MIATHREETAVLRVCNVKELMDIDIKYVLKRTCHLSATSPYMKVSFLAAVQDFYSKNVGFCWIL